MFGFSTRWIQWIKECLSSVSYSILLNGNPHGLIILTRGLRQGDPFSPFVFVIGMEILSRMLNKARDLSLLKRISLNANGPYISHLLYTDDILLFGQMTPREASTLQLCLWLFLQWSRKAPNP